MRARKQIYAIIRWTVFALVILFSSMQCFAQLDPNLNRVSSVGLVGIGYLFLSLVSIASYLLETIALCRFLKIVHRAGINQHLKSYLLWLQIMGLAIWVTGWIIESYFYMRHYSDISEYKPVKYGLIADAVGIVSNTCNLIVVAIVIYKSVQHVRQDKTLLENMINKYTSEQERKNSQINVSSNL